MVVMLSTQCLCSKIICAHHRGALNQDSVSSVIPRRVSEGQIRGRCPRTVSGERQQSCCFTHVAVRCKLQRRLPMNVKVMMSQRSQQTLEYKDLNV